ncbi:hypothetical protein [Azospirillum agricola]|nr:hypothetical protein [Azospirillum agricola]SMH60461.1 hypothetical protein SAMN02982994_5504 [Azospirillum lipoferum]
MLHRLRLFIGRVILWFAMPALTHEVGRMTPEDWAEVDPCGKPTNEGRA